MLRLSVYVAMLLLAIVVEDGRTCMAIALGGTVLALFLQVSQAPSALRLNMMWQVAFVAVVCVEGTMDADSVSRFYGRWAYDEACRYLLGANAICMLGHAIAFQERSVGPVSPAISWRRQLSSLLVIGGAYVFYMFFTVPVAIRAWQGGRSAAADAESAGGALAPILSGIASSAGMILPALITYYILKVRGGRFTTALAFSVPVFLTQFAIGTRFPILISVMGAVIVWMVPRRPSVRGLLRLAIVGLLLVAASAVMRQSRTQGLAQQADAAALDDSTVMRGEGVVNRMAMIVKYADGTDLLYGRSSSAVLFFWIPRAVWPSKPALLGYWLPRTVGNERVGQGHSVSYTFAGDAYLDFGKYGGWLFWLLGGMLFGLGERAVARALSVPNHRFLVLAAPLFGLVFFAVRSINTAFIVLSGLVLIGLVFGLTLKPQDSLGRLGKRRD